MTGRRLDSGQGAGDDRSASIGADDCAGGNGRGLAVYLCLHPANLPVLPEEAFYLRLLEMRPGNNCLLLQ